MKHLYRLDSASNQEGGDDYWLEHSESCPCITVARFPVRFYDGTFVWIDAADGAGPPRMAARVSTEEVPAIFAGRGGPYLPIVEALFQREEAAKRTIDRARRILAGLETGGNYNLG